MKRLFYIDTYSTGPLHEMFNAASLKVFSMIFDKIEYFADSSAQEHSYHLMDNIPTNITYHPIHVPVVKSSFSNWQKIAYAIFNNCRLLLQAKDSDIIYINYNTIYALPFINLITKFSKKKVLLQCHGELKQLQKDYHQNFISQKILSLLNSSRIHITQNLYICVLGDIIKDNLRNFVTPYTINKIISFDHPGIFTESIPSKISLTKKLKIGYIGTLRKNKGIKEFLELAAKFKNNSTISFYSIGKKNNYTKNLENAGIIIPNECNQNYINRKDLYKMIQNLDIVLYLYDKNSYKLTASGAIFDAIECEKPILALKNDYFEYLFKKFGSLGFLANNLVELENEIERLNNGKQYNINFKAIKQSLGCESIASELEKKLSQIHLL